MKLFYALIIALIGISGPAMARPSEPVLPSEIFSLGKVNIGVTTIAEAQKVLGRSPTFRPNAQDESPLQICYLVESPKDRFYVVFESGAMGGFTRITGFGISRQRPEHRCGSLQSPMQVIPGNGVEIGQTRKEFLSKFAIEFIRGGDNLSFQAKTKRAASTEELRSLKKAWPKEKVYQLDVFVSIQAHFEDGRLFKYEVSKIESY